MADGAIAYPPYAAGIESQWIAERRSAVKNAFEKVLGESVAKLFLIHTLGKNNQRCYKVDPKVQTKNTLI